MEKNNNWQSFYKEWPYDQEIDLTKRYYVFGYNQYYPSGGIEDIKVTFNNEKEAIEYAKKSKDDYVHILDRISGLFLYIK